MPIVIVEAENAEGAFAEADDFLDVLIENADGYFDGARVIKDREPIRAGTPEYRAVVDDALGAEAAMVQEYWDKLRTAIPPLADRPTIPADDDQVRVRFRHGAGFAGVVEAGTDVDTETSFGLLIYDIHKLYCLKDHLADRFGTHPGSDARVYDARCSAAVPMRAVEGGVYAVWVDLHY